MTLSRLELGFESPWGRQKIKIATYSLLLSNAANPNKIKGTRFILLHSILTAVTAAQSACVTGFSQGISL